MLMVPLKVLLFFQLSMLGVGSALAALVVVDTPFFVGVHPAGFAVVLVEYSGLHSADTTTWPSG
jgi:hypothetical protein